MGGGPAWRQPGLPGATTVARRCPASHYRRAQAKLHLAAGQSRRPDRKFNSSADRLHHPPLVAAARHGAHHPECPDRLHAIGDRLIAAGLDAYLRHYTARAATHEEIARVHGAAYIDTIEAASPQSGLHFIDPDTALNPHSLTAARHAAGALALATDLVLSGECKTAFCAVRPPGHHAERDRAMGFCLFNNVAVGAAHAMARHGVERIAVIDFDVHHGNGTENIFAAEPRVLMVSTFHTR